MSTRIIVLVNLKPGVSAEDYEKFARERDIPACNSLPSIDKFEVFRSAGLFRTGDVAPYQYVEIVDVKDMDQFGEDVATEMMKDIAATFRGMADPIFILTDKL